MVANYAAMNMTTMPRHRVLVQLPEEIAAAIDKLAGARNRATFVAEQRKIDGLRKREPPH
jgi:hypothetical protein